jgi:hypothetical protein
MRSLWIILLVLMLNACSEIQTFEQTGQINIPDTQVLYLWFDLSCDGVTIKCLEFVY